MYLNIILSFLLCKYYIDCYFDLKNKKIDVLPKIELDKIDNVIKIDDENITKYESLENIYRFIQNMDIIVSRKIKNEALSKIIPDQIIGFLYSIYINKYKNLTKEEYHFF